MLFAISMDRLVALLPKTGLSGVPPEAVLSTGLHILPENPIFNISSASSKNYGVPTVAIFTDGMTVYMVHNTSRCTYNDLCSTFK